MMKLYRLSLSACGLLIFLGLSLSAQPGDDEGPGKKGPPPFELGKILPPFVREALDLTQDQEKQIADLEKAVRAKLLKILTREQQKRISEMTGKGPKGPNGKGKDKGPKGPPQGRDKGDLPDRPPLVDDATTSYLVKPFGPSAHHPRAGCSPPIAIPALISFRGAGNTA